jgi:tRNA(Met) cytidine acetyltransferase
VHLGSRRNAASGAHAAVVLKALTPAGTALFDAGRRRLLPRLAVLLAGPLRELEPAVTAALLAGVPAAPAPLTDAEHRELHAFADAARGLDATRPALHRLLCRMLPEALAQGHLSGARAYALIACGLQMLDPGDAAPRLDAPGADAVLRTLRAATAALLRPSPGPHATR